MVKYIEFGEYNKNYNYIILAVVFSILLKYIPQFLITLLFKYNKITIKVVELYNHSYIMTIFISFGLLVFSCILNIIESKLSKRESNVDKLYASNSDRGCFKNIKIIEEKKKEKLNNKKNLLYILKYN